MNTNQETLKLSGKMREILLGEEARVCAGCGVKLDTDDPRGTQGGSSKPFWFGIRTNC